MRTFLLSLLIPVVVQAGAKAQATPIPVSEALTVLVAPQPGGSIHQYAGLVVSDQLDSLVTKRSFFSTSISQQGKNLSSRAVIQLLNDIPRAKSAYRWGLALKPVGPLLAASGLALGYVAIRGTLTKGFVRGIGINAPDVPVEYTTRSLPKLLGGIGLVVGGLCLIEVANGLTRKSVTIYNASVVPRRLAWGLHDAGLGLTTSGNLGLEAHF